MARSSTIFTYNTSLGPPSSYPHNLQPLRMWLIAVALAVAILLNATPTFADHNETTGMSVVPTVLPEQCLKGSHHKSSPSKESEQFLECTSFRDASCCTVNVSNEVHHHRAKTLYAFHWDLCGELSPACERFLKWEECFYQCEPTLIYYENPAKLGYIRDVPICASFCNRWFEVRIILYYWIDVAYKIPPLIIGALSYNL